MAGKKAKRFRVLADGINYPGKRGERRAEKDAIVDDLEEFVSERTIASWKHNGIIEEYIDPQTTPKRSEDAEEEA